MKYIIFALLISAGLQAQDFNFMCFVGGNAYETHYGINLDTPHDMYAAFEQDVLDYNSTNTDEITLPSRPYPKLHIVPADMWVKDEKVAAYTWYCDTTPEVMINGVWWNNPDTSFELKMLVIYHELGHAILNYTHTCNEGDIMVSPGEAAEDEDCNGTSPASNLSAFLIAKDNMLAGIDQISYACYSGKLFNNNEIID